MASRTNCAAFNCSNAFYKGKAFSFFRFPTDELRCARWRINCRTSSLDDKSPEELHKNYRLCSKHFEASQFMNSTRNSLVHNAVPTIFDVPNAPMPVSLKRKHSERSQLFSAKRRQTAQNSANCGQSPSTIEHSNVLDLNEVSVHRSCKSTPKELRLSSSLAYTKRCLVRCRMALLRLKSKSVQSSNRCFGICKQLQRLPVNRRNVIDFQIKTESCSRRGVRWTNHMKMLALGLFYKSPAAYKFMSRQLRLPCVRTLQTFISSFRVQVGFSSDYIRALHRRVESMNEQERFAVVTFDSMSLRSSLKYNEHEDRIRGFVDLDEFSADSETRDVAKHALQFMVRGVSTRWKQPIGHYFTGNSVPADVLCRMIQKLVSLLQSMKVVVVAIVCDQEASHRVCLASLNVTCDQPWFFAESGQKVYVMHDMPHLMKNTRNALLTNDVIINDKIISFDHIAELYNLESKSVLRFAPKLTKDHLHVKVFKRMSVKLATQVLSHSVGAAIQTYVHFNRMSTDSLATGEFVQRMDQIFDVMNSQTLKASNKWKKPLTCESKDHFAVLESAVAWIKTWKFRNKSTGKIKDAMPFKDGLIMTVTAVHELCKELLTTHGFKFVLTSRFNQDIVENWFSCIRAKGHNNDSRTTLEYESASRNVSVNWFIEQPERSTNCEVDYDEFLGVVATLQSQSNSSAADCEKENSRTLSNNKCSNSNTTESQDKESLDSPKMCSIDLDWSEDGIFISDWIGVYMLTDIDSNIVCYLAGWISKKLSDQTSCNQCKDCYNMSRESESTGVLEQQKQFIINKQFNWAKHGLTLPSQQLFSLCESVEKVVQLNLEGLGPRHSLMSNLRQCVFASVNIHSFSVNSVCSDHQHQVVMQVLNLYLKVRIHHFVRIRNRELKDLDAVKKIKRNRKAKKVLHQ